MDKENYRKVVKICEKGRCKVREKFIWSLLVCKMW
nr:MAG TPA: hypothetical protein [Bacteriophage sp.]